MNRSRSVMPPAVLAMVTRSDRWLRVTLLLFAASLGTYYLLPLPAPKLELLTTRYVFLAFLVLVVASLRRDLPQVTSQQEQRFWSDLQWAYVSWLLVAILYLFFPDTDSRPLLVNVAADFAFAVYYTGWLLAVEGRPHLRSRWRPTGLERQLDSPSISLFVLVLFGYFSILPTLFARGEYESFLPSMYLFLVLDAYLTARLLTSAIRARSGRWRRLYGLLATAAAVTLAGDLFETLLFYLPQAPEWASAVDPWYSLPLVLLVVAARHRHRPVSEKGTGPHPAIDHLSGSSRRTLIFALSIPLLHFFLYRLELLEESSRGARELLVLGAVGGLGGLGLYQQLLLRSRLQVLSRERRKVERALRKSQASMRLILERQATEKALKTSQDRFVKAFRHSPYSIAITTLDGGRFLEVNESHERMTGYSRQEVLGRTSAELGMWHDPEQRARMRELLQRDGRLRNLRADIRVKSGDLRALLFSAEPIHIQGEDCWISVVREVVEAPPPGEGAGGPAAWLDLARCPMALLAPGDRVISWNAAAARLFGWPPEGSSGGSTPALPCGDAPEPWRQARRLATERGRWSGELRAATADGDRTAVHSLWCRAVSATARDDLILILAREIRVDEP